MELHIVTTRDLDRAGSHHARAGRRHLQHLLERDHVELAGAGTRRGSAVKMPRRRCRSRRVGAERGRERDCGRVRAAAPQRRDVVVGRDPWNPRRGRSGPRREPRGSAARGRRRSSPCRGRVRDDPGLRPGQRDRLVAEVVDGHRAERARDPLADRDQHVELARVGPIRDPAREVEQLVGRVPHRREDADDAVRRLARRDQSPRHVLDHLRVGERRAAELHHDGAGLRLSSEDGRDRFVLDRRHRIAERSRELGCGLSPRGESERRSPDGREARRRAAGAGAARAAAGSWSTASSSRRTGEPTASGSGHRARLGCRRRRRPCAIRGDSRSRTRRAPLTTAGSVHARTTGAAGLRTGRAASSATAEQLPAHLARGRSQPDQMRRRSPERFRPTVPSKRKAFAALSVDAETGRRSRSPERGLEGPRRRDRPERARSRSRRLDRCAGLAAADRPSRGRAEVDARRRARSVRVGRRRRPTLRRPRAGRGGKNRWRHGGRDTRRGGERWRRDWKRDRRRWQRRRKGG